MNKNIGIIIAVVAIIAIAAFAYSRTQDSSQVASDDQQTNQESTVDNNAVESGESMDADGEAMEGTDQNTGAQTYTLAEVSENNDRSSCWTAIDGTVYDLTDWIAKHPGGAANILRLCGTDGTEAFNGQHGGNAQAEAALTNFSIGTLAN